MHWEKQKPSSLVLTTHWCRLSHGMDPDFFDLEAILPSGKHIHPGKDLTFYNYPGSLTQPPCTEGVDWWVTAEPVEATKEEIGALRKAIMSAEPTKKGNNRNAQAPDPARARSSSGIPASSTT